MSFIADVMDSTLNAVNSCNKDKKMINVCLNLANDIMESIDWGHDSILEVMEYVKENNKQTTEIVDEFIKTNYWLNAEIEMRKKCK